VASDREHSHGQVGDPADRGQQDQPCPERQAQTQFAGQRLMLGPHSGDEDGDEH